MKIEKLEKGERRHIFRYIALAVLIIILIFCFLQLVSHGSGLSESQLAQRPHRLSVLTWNTGRMGGFVKPEKNEVLQYLLRQDADVICLQEVDVYKDAKYLTLPDVKQTLSTKYPYSYIDFSVYNKRHQYGTMVWSKYPIIHKQSINYESQGNLSNQCDIIVNEDTIRVINNHLESYKFTSADKDDLGNMRQKMKRSVPLRIKQARAVKRMVNTSPYPTIVVGDFNAIPLSYTYLHIKHGMHDAFLETSWFRLGPTCKKKGIGIRIDYILSSSSLKPVNCTVDYEATGSDHWPVAATFAW